MSSEIQLFLLDYDGCLGASTPAEIKQNNVAFFDYALEKISSALSANRDGCKVVLAIGSNRQTPQHDFFNMSVNKNGSCATLLPAIQERLNEILVEKGLHKKVSVEICRFLITDLYQNTAPGTTLSLIETAANTQIFPDVVSTISDHHKVTLIYAFLHHIANIHQNSKIDCHFFDDVNNGVLNMLNSVYEEHYRSHLPSNCNLYLVQYVRRNIAIRYNQIQGCGEISHELKASLFGFMQHVYNRYFPNDFIPAAHEPPLSFEADIEIKKESFDRNVDGEVSILEQEYLCDDEILTKLSHQSDEAWEKLLPDALATLSQTDDFIVCDLNSLERNMRGLVGGNIVKFIYSNKVIDADSAFTQLGRNYRKLCLKYHPDKSSRDQRSAEQSLLFNKLQDCYAAIKLSYESGEFAALLIKPDVVTQDNSGRLRVKGLSEAQNQSLNRAFQFIENKSFAQFKDEFLDRTSDLNEMINIQDHVDKTLLMCAAEKGNTEIVEALLSRGARVHLRDMGSKTALHYAVEGGFDEIVSLLMQYGANKHSLAYDDATPISLALNVRNINDSLVAALGITHKDINRELKDKRIYDDDENIKKLITGSQHPLIDSFSSNDCRAIISSDTFFNHTGLQLLETKDLLSKIFLVHGSSYLPDYSVMDSINSPKRDLINKGLIPQNNFCMKGTVGCLGSEEIVPLVLEKDASVFKYPAQKIQYKFAFLAPISTFKGGIIDGDMENVLFAHHHRYGPESIAIIPEENVEQFSMYNPSYQGTIVTYNPRTTSLSQKVDSVLDERKLFLFNHQKKTVSGSNMLYKYVNKNFRDYFKSMSSECGTIFETIKLHMGCFGFDVDKDGSSVLRPLSEKKSLMIRQTINDNLNTLSAHLPTILNQTHLKAFSAWKKQIQSWMTLYLRERNQIESKEASRETPLQALSLFVYKKTDSGAPQSTTEKTSETEHTSELFSQTDKLADNILNPRSGWF